MRRLLMVGLILMMAFPLFADKKDDIRTLLNITGAGEQGVQAMKMMIGNFKKSMPQVPEKFWTEFMKEVKPGDLVEMIIPIYEKHFTEADIKAIIAFYNTPVGKKFIMKQPVIQQESFKVGSAWGRKLGMRVAAKLQEFKKKK